jgi:hypothetical protein
MALFRRAKSSQPDSTSPADAPKKEKGSWKRPASAFSDLPDFPLAYPSFRYRVQAAATEGLAAYSDTKDGPSDAPHHWHPLCSHWRSPRDWQ